MIILADSMESFLDIVEELVKRGLGFVANASTLQIKLTGMN